MAVTSGHGNPKWTREEVILALELYIECGEKTPPASDSKVKELSDLLRSFPHHSEAARKPSFRNPDGVAFKLQNLRQVATGKGLGNVSKVDRTVWNELGSEPYKLKMLATLIKAGINTLNEVRENEPSYDVFAEGRVVTETHLRRERDPVLRARLIEQRKKKGQLTCDLCAKGTTGIQASFAESTYEAHHIIPLALGEERSTRIADMALLCACCHRLVHKAIASEGRWIDLAEARKFIYGEHP